MKHVRFESLGTGYPHALEQRFDRILSNIDRLWDTPDIDNYFSDLIIDRRGGRQGFQKDILDDILRLRDLRESETLRRAEAHSDAVRELDLRGIPIDKDRFFSALHQGNKELVDLFIRAGFNIHLEDADGTPPVLIALKKGYTVITQILLNAGADVNARDRMGLTPLLIACGKATHGYQAIAELLINKGAFVNVHDRLGYTPLLLSLSGGTIEVAELLIEKGADIYACSKNGETALSLAEQAGNARIVALLNDKGARPVTESR